MRPVRVIIAVVALGLAGAPSLHSQNAPPPAEPVFYALGTVAVSNLYTSFSMLASVADGYAAGSYSAETVRALAEEVLALSGSSRTALEELLATRLVASRDAEILTDMVAVHALISAQARGLLLFVDDPGLRRVYQSARDETWSKLVTLLQVTPALEPSAN